MEQIKVNMIPNGEVKTIHCSKGDGKTRKWGFELYKEDGKIPASSISPQMFFDSYKGGTEEILPENGSEPTTSPIIADIQYPDALRSEQEFLYRESPTQEDGKAKINRIKGNTLVWNQLVQNGNFADTSHWSTTNCSFSVSGNVGKMTATAQWGRTIGDDFYVISGHKYYWKVEAKGMTDNFVEFNFQNIYLTKTNEWEKISRINTPNSSGNAHPLFGDRRASGWTEFDVQNFMVIDMTALGKDSMTLTEFENWLSNYYPLPYYAYTTGKLLPFLGEELKTTGKNLIESFISQYNVDANGVISSSPAYKLGIAKVIKNETYTLQYSTQINIVYGFFNEYPQIGSSTYNGSRVVGGSSTFVSPIDGYIALRCDISETKAMIEFGSTATDYEAYQSSTLSLPISTYFPAGMKSAGSVYDELTESKATVRVGSVDLGTLTWNYNSTYQIFISDGSIASLPTPITSRNAYCVCSKYVPLMENTALSSIPNMSIACSMFSITLSRNTITVKDTSYSDVATFKQMLIDQNVKLYYELATPTETAINTASLVSEQAEIPLYEDDDILIGECTTQLSSESGFIPTKIKYQDDNGIAYSQKINLHVEQ